MHPARSFAAAVVTLSVCAIPSASTAQEAGGAVGAGRAVLITGASSGIGRTTAERLAAEGFYVYAGARKESDLAELNAIENIHAVRLDVNSDEHIAEVIETIDAEGRGLYALINNAGVAVVAPLIEVDEDDVRFQFDVNVFGPYRVTKAFAPMLIESQGRVLTTGSISGFLAGPLSGPYSMSKHAIEAFTDSLAAELSPFGVRVSVIDPGTYRSDISQSLLERLQDSGYSSENSLYKEQMNALLGSNPDRSQYKEPDEVAEAFLDALIS
ncbi:MAG: SDR family oxidoreductase, partial [Phycisphaerales bacterium JB041]